MKQVRLEIRRQPKTRRTLTEATVQEAAMQKAWQRIKREPVPAQLTDKDQERRVRRLLADWQKENGRFPRAHAYGKQRSNHHRRVGRGFKG